MSSDGETPPKSPASTTSPSSSWDVVDSQSPHAVTTNPTAAATNTSRPARTPPIFSKWTFLTEQCIHKAMVRFVQVLSQFAARNPYRTIFSILFGSLALIATGFFTNFNIIYNHEEIFTPFGSLPLKHREWIRNESGFETNRHFLMLIHKNGDDSVLSVDAIRQVFDVLVVLEATPGYQEACQQSSFISTTTNQNTCQIFSPTQFWNNNRDEFEQALKSSDIAQEEYLLQQMSQPFYPDRAPVVYDPILGNYQLQNVTANDNTTTTALTAAEAFIITVYMPDLGITSEELEKRMLDRMQDLRDEWQTQDDVATLEFFTLYAYLLEFERAVYSDIHLVFIMISIMVAFCSLVFFKRKDRVRSRAVMGQFSIATIGNSLMAGYGIMWIIGVPFTNITMMVPFVVMGIGLDDTFIITGAYFRKSALAAAKQRQSNNENTSSSSRDEQILKRVQETMEEVGLSISLTTTTTMLAFGLGAFSSTIPAIHWMCLYGFTCIGVDFIFQITFFVACMVLDERRVMANRKDCCIWVVVQEDDQDDESEERNMEEETTANKTSIKDSSTDPSTTTENTENFSERFMGWYSDKLLQPVSKVVVLTVFAAYLAGCVYSTTLLTQEFKVDSYVPKDSHVRTFFESFATYSISSPIGVYFRNVDQADQSIQQQMIDYVDELSQMDQIGEPPRFFWLPDFAAISASDEGVTSGLANMTFEEQNDVLLNIPEIRFYYGANVVRDPTTGAITASRCYLFVDELDLDSVPDQVDVLLDQRAITLAQPINQDTKELSFFTFDDLYFYWELYTVTVDELIFTTISGVTAVSVISFVLIPHWSAMLFVTPLIISLYFMLLGTIQYWGMHINTVSYVLIVMSIGLLVDFLMHVLLRYYETPGSTRNEKVKGTLKTMGASVLLGGLTTFLGVIPLVFSATTVFMVVFKSFLAMVLLGCGVGLIVLPVLLSLVGPIVFKPHGSFHCVESSEQAQDNNDFTPSDTKEYESSDEDNRIYLAKTSSNGGGYELDATKWLSATSWEI